MAAPVMLKRSANEAFSELDILRQSELNGGSIVGLDMNGGSLGLSLDELDAHIQRSPIKMLNTVARSRPLKKLRRESNEYMNGSVEVVTDHSDTSSSPEPHPELVVDMAMNGHAKIEVEDTVPKVNGHRSFPCVWMDGSDPLRSQEGGETSPQTPFDYPQSQPMSTPPPPPMSPAVNGLMSMSVNGDVSTGINKSPGVNGVNGHIVAAINGPLSAVTPKGPDTPRSHPFGSPFGIAPLKSSAMMSLVAESGTASSDSEMSEAVAAAEVVPPEVCPECRKVFKRRVYLQRHMEREHWSTAKVFKCDDCSYETKHQSNLSVHRRTHTGERPYHCGACGQRYTQGHLLKSHIRSRHAGNMQFYNLEKKSDSTRGRKSLDPKHDHMSSLSGGLGSHKQDKISALLAAASGQCTPQQSQQHQMRFGGLFSPATINQYMNALSPFPVHPMMSPQVAALSSSLLMTPQLFALGGIPGVMPAIGNAMLPGTLRQGMPMMTTATTAAMAQQGGIATTAGNAGIKIPLKVPEIPNPAGSASFFPMDTAGLFSAAGAGGSIFPTSGGSDSFSPKIRELTSDDELAPEDLSTKKTTAEDKKVAMETDIEKAISHEPAAQDLSNYTKYEDASDSPYDHHAAISRDLAWPTACKPFSDASTMTDKCCADLPAKCPYRRELRQLRRNILRMLSVFTPELNIENGIDCNSNQVDQLLHEVINSEDEANSVGLNIDTGAPNDNHVALNTDTGAAVGLNTGAPNANG